MDKLVESAKSIACQAKPKLLEYQAQLDKQLATYPIFLELEERTKVPKTYLVLGAGALASLMIILDIGAKFLVNLVGFVYPAYSCFKAIESPEKDDDVQWLTYWIINSFFQVIEYFSDILLYWIPFYFVWKALFLIYLYAPQTKVCI